jgi:hypothetical protein
MKGKEAFQKNAQEWKNLSEQEKNKYQLEADQVCTCYNTKQHFRRIFPIFTRQGHRAGVFWHRL